LLVEDGHPRCSSIGGPPYASIDGSEVKRSAIAGNAADGNGAAGAKGADQSPLEVAEELRSNGLG
jgi:hypothetical protein